MHHFLIDPLQLRLFNCIASIQWRIVSKMSVLTVLLLIVFLLVVIRLLHRNFVLAWKIKGPTLYPFVGNWNVLLMNNGRYNNYILHPCVTCLTSPTVQFFPFLRACARQFNGVFRLWSFGIIHVQATRAREAEILMNSSAHAKKPYIYKILHDFLGLGLLNSNGEKWRDRRKMLTPTFHFNILKNLTAIFKEESLKTVNKVKLAVDRGETFQDVSILACEYTMPTICESAMGVKVENMKEAADYRKNLLDLIQMFPVRLVRSYLHPDFMCKLLGFTRKQKRYLKPIHHFTRTVIEKRRQMFYETKSSIEDLQNENM